MNSDVFSVTTGSLFSSSLSFSSSSGVKYCNSSSVSAYSFLLILSFGRDTLILRTTIGRLNSTSRFRKSLKVLVFPENEISKGIVSIAPSTFDVTDDPISKMEESP